MCSGDRTASALLAHGAATRAVARFARVPRVVREELAQEATLRTLAARDVREPGPFAGRVASRLAIDWLRRSLEVPLGDDPVDARGEEARTDVLLDLSRVAAVVARAPRRHRETLQLLFLEDLTIDELLARRPLPPADRARERDRLYKRRRRALAWIRDEVSRALA